MREAPLLCWVGEILNEELEQDRSEDLAALRQEDNSLAIQIVDGGGVVAEVVEGDISHVDELCTSIIGVDASNRSLGQLLARSDLVSSDCNAGSINGDLVQAGLVGVEQSRLANQSSVSHLAILADNLHVVGVANAELVLGFRTGVNNGVEGVREFGVEDEHEVRNAVAVLINELDRGVGQVRELVNAGVGRVGALRSGAFLEQELGLVADLDNNVSQVARGNIVGQDVLEAVSDNSVSNSRLRTA